MGFLQEKIKSGSLLKQYGSQPTSMEKSVSGSLVKLMLIRLYTLFSIYHFFASPQTLISFSLSFSSRGQSLKLLYSAVSNCESVRMPLYQRTSLRQLIWKHMQISSISLTGVEKLKYTTKGPIVKYSPSFTSTPYLGMFIHVPFSLPKSNTSKFLNPSNFSWACLGDSPAPQICRVNPYNLASPAPSISPSLCVVMQRKRFLKMPSMQSSTYLICNSAISVILIL